MLLYEGEGKYEMKMDNIKLLEVSLVRGTKNWAVKIGLSKPRILTPFKKWKYVEWVTLNFIRSEKWNQHCHLRGTRDVEKELMVTERRIKRWRPEERTLPPRRRRPAAEEWCYPLSTWCDRRASAFLSSCESKTKANREFLKNTFQLMYDWLINIHFFLPKYRFLDVLSAEISKLRNRIAN